MCSRFDSMFASMGRPTLMDHLGEGGDDGDHVVYTPLDRDPQQLVAILTEDPENVEAGEQGRTRQRTMLAIVSVEDVPDPQPGDKLAVDGLVWVVREIASRSASVSRLRLVRAGSVERSRPAYRGGSI